MKDRLNPFQLLRDHGNGSSQWKGPGGAVVDVHHEAPGMEQFRPPQQQIADNSGPILNSQDREAVNLVDQWTNMAPQSAQAQAPAQAQPRDMFDAAAWERPAQAAPSATPPLPPEAQRRLAEAAAAPIGPSLQAPGQSPMALPATGNTANAHVPNAGAPAQRLNYYQPPQGASGASSSAVAAPVVTNRGAPRSSAMVPHAVSTTTQTGAQLPDGLVDGVRTGSDNAASAALHTGKNEQSELAQNAQTLADRNRIVGGLGGLMDQSVANEQGRGDRLEQARLNFDDIANRARSMTVDPDRRSGGDRVTGAIASLLGGIGSGITGGPNHAVQIIQHAIDRDVEAQRSNVANAQHGTAAAQTAYQLARDQGASEREAENLHMGFEYRKAADEVERLAALTGSQEAMDEATIVAERLRAQGATLVGNLANIGSDRTSTTVQQRRVNTGGGGGTQTLVQQVDAQGNYIPGSPLIPLSSLPSAAQTAIIENRAPNLRIVSGVGGGNANAPLSSSDQTASRDYAQRMEAFDQAERSLDELERAVQAGDTGRVRGNLPEIVAPGATVAASRAYENFINHANRAMNSARATDQDRENVRLATGSIVSEGAAIGIQDVRDARERLRIARERIAAGVNDAVVQHNEARVGGAPATPSSYTRGQ